MATLIQIKPCPIATNADTGRLRQVHVQGLRAQIAAWPCLSDTPLSSGIKSKSCCGSLTKRRYARGVVAMSSETAQFAKEMERVAAKEALLLAIADAGGIEALTSGKGSAIGRIDVAERILALERLNPTPRPTTSPLLEGVWEFKWAGARSPGVLAARLLLKRLPKQVASIDSLTLAIGDGSAIATATVKFLSSVGTTFSITSKLTYEGPLRLKEEYSEGLLSTPSVAGGDVPSQVKGLLDSAASAIESLPANVKESLQGGLKIPLAGTYERKLIISYLDDEIMVARNEAGVPDVLQRTTVADENVPADSLDSSDPTEYES